MNSIAPKPVASWLGVFNELIAKKSDNFSHDVPLQHALEHIQKLYAVKNYKQ